jgi:hypothetical protein
MTNVRRLLVIFLLLAGWSFAGVQRVDAQKQNTRVIIPDPQSAPKALALAKDFSVGRRIGAIFMNPLLGLGSYTMGDVSGGLFITTGYAFAAGLILWDRFGLDDYESIDDHKYEIAGIPFIAGLGVAGVTTVFGILRPIFYQRTGFSRGEFSTGSRIGMAALNPFLGMGSYIMGDWIGGLIQSVGYGTALGLIAWDVSGIDYADGKAGVPGLIGMGVAGATVVFGIIRPFVYHCTGSRNKAAEVFRGVNLAVIPDAAGAAVHLGYHFQY